MFEQDNSIMRELVNLQREQLMEIRRLRGDNYSPSFTPDANSFSPYSLYSQDTVSYSQPKTSFLQSTIDKQRDMFNNSIMNSNMRVSNQQKDLMGIEWANRQANAAVAGINATAGAVGDFAVGGLLAGAGAGFVGSIVGGIAGGALIGGTTSIGLNQMKQHQDINRFLFNNSYKYIQTAESNNNRYGAGFTMEERQDAASFIRNINSSKFLKDNEVQEMLADFTSYNLLKTVTDVEDFKETTSKLIDSTKTAALTLNKTYKEITQMMSDLKKVGISATGEEFLNTMGMFRAIGNNTGTDAATLGSNIIDIVKQTNYGTSIDGATSVRNLSMATNYMSEIKNAISQNPNRDPGDEKIYNLINSYGNDTTAAYTITENIMSAMGNSELMKGLYGSVFSINDKGVVYTDQDKIRNLKNILATKDENKIQLLADETLAAFQKDPELANKIINGVNFKNNLKDMKIEDFMSIAGSISEGVSNSSGLKRSFGLAVQGLTNEEEAIFGTMMKDINRNYVNSIDIQSQFIAANSAAQAMTPGFNDVVGASLDKIKDKVGNVFAGISDAFEPLGVAYNEFMYGKGSTYMNMKSLGMYDYSTDGRDNYYKTQGNVVAESFNKAMKIGEDSGIKISDSKVYKNYGEYEADIYDAEKFIEKVTDTIQGKDVGLDASYKDIIGNVESQIKDLEKQEKSYKNKDVWKYGVGINREILDEYKNAINGEYSAEATKFAISRLQKVANGEGVTEMGTAYTQQQREGAKKLIENLNKREDIAMMKQELSVGIEGISDVKDRGVQSGLNAMNVIKLLSSYSEETGIGKATVKNALEESIDRLDFREKRGENASLQDIMEWEKADKNLISKTFSKMGDERINDFLSRNEVFRDLIGMSELDSKKGWSSSDIDSLATKLMEIANNSAPKTSFSSESTTGAIDGLEESLKNHEETFGKVAKVMENETKIMKDILDGKDTYNKKWFEWGRMY